MKFGIVILPGSNCDHDALHVTKNVLGAEVEVLWHKETELKGVDCVIIPGGFAYGDYLRAGALAKFGPGFGLTRGSDRIITKFNVELEHFVGSLL